MFLLTLLLLASCGTAGSDQNVSDNQSLFSKWQLVQVTHGSLGLSLGGTRPPFTLELREDGTARGQVACNTWTGQTRVSRDLLRLQRVQVSRRACTLDDARVGALARRYPGALQTASHHELNGDELILTLSTGEVWLFNRQ